MKTTSVITTLLFGAGAVNAAAVAGADALAARSNLEVRQGCPRVGQPCWKVKRVADAFASAIHGNEARSVAPAGGDQLTARELSHLPGGAAYDAKRSLDALAATLASTQEDPEVFYNSLQLDRYLDPDTSAAAAAEKRDAHLEARQGCPRVGQPCYKRDVEHDKRHCNQAGEACDVARRAAEALLAEAEAADGLSKRQGCPRVGQPCWKRAADFEPVALGRRDVETSSLEARCYGPGGFCTKAQRDFNAVQMAARDVLASLE